jgi:hypothetical protein
MRGSPAKLFSQVDSLTPIDPCSLMTARARRVSQTIIEVEACSLYTALGGEGRQAELPMAGRVTARHTAYR